MTPFNGVSYVASM